MRAARHPRLVPPQPVHRDVILTSGEWLEWRVTSGRETGTTRASPSTRHSSLATQPLATRATAGQLRPCCICSITQKIMSVAGGSTPEPLQLGRHLAAMIGRMVDDVPQDGPGRQDRGPAAAAEGPRRGQLLGRQAGIDCLEDLVSPIEQPLGVVDRGQFGLGRNAPGPSRRRLPAASPRSRSRCARSTSGPRTSPAAARPRIARASACGKPRGPAGRPSGCRRRGKRSRRSWGRRLIRLGWKRSYTKDSDSRLHIQNSSGIPTLWPYARPSLPRAPLTDLVPAGR